MASLKCVSCSKEIREGDRKYLSRQAGMKGYYHWSCFVDACRQANKAGAQEIESLTISDSVFENHQSVDLVND